MAAPTSEQVASALRAAGLTEVDTSDRRRAEYSTDASLYRVVPSVVAFPRAVEELAAALQVCRDTATPLVVRGGGTSIAGNAVGTGVVLDVSQHLHTIRSIDPERRTATVESGVVLADLQRSAGRHGLRFGPDPSSQDRCTIGGMIGNNACGSRALAYGRTADNVIELDVVTGTGERLTARRGADPSTSATLTALHGVVQSRLGLIRTELGRFSRQISGYSLEHLLPERGFDVARALVGTEGSCALTLGATLRLVPVPALTALVVVGYPDLASAADAVPGLLPLGATAIEGMDERIVDAVRGRRGDRAVPPLPRGRGWLLVEVSGADSSELTAAAEAVVRAAGAPDARVVTDPSDMARLWRIRADGAGYASRPAANRRAHAGWEDSAVPPQRLGAYVRDFEALLVGHGLTGVPYGHFGDGCLHVRIDFDLTASRGVTAFRRFLTEAAGLVASCGGSMSGEHGDGRARSELLPLMYSADAIAAFAAVKGVFDPDDVLNPGVVVRPEPVVSELRLPLARPVRAGLAFAYTEDGGDFTRAVHRCIGVGSCRADTTASGGVMCPSYLATRDEKDSTRGRARVLQEMANGSLVTGWRDHPVHEALDLCLACKGCATDCPTGVDMATYKAEVLYQTYRRRLRPPAHYALGWLPRWARLAARAPNLTNWLLASPLAGAGKRIAGVDGRRDLPSFAAQTFSAWFAARGPNHGSTSNGSTSNGSTSNGSSGTSDPVVLWVDTFTEHFRPEVGMAAVAVLESAGYSVQVPAGPLCCGLTWISTGQLDTARAQLRRSIAALDPYVTAGVPVVGLEPSCTAVFRGDAAELLRGDHRAVRVGAAVRTLAELLSARPGWAPPDLSGVTVLAQPHCHQHAVMGWSVDQDLIERAEASVRSVGGCCGLAGNFGVERGHYDVSVAVAETALLPALRSAGADATVLADGFSCRTQIQQLAGRPSLHLAELLASAAPRAPRVSR